jgi:deoxyribonuclease V
MQRERKDGGNSQGGGRSDLVAMRVGSFGGVQGVRILIRLRAWCQRPILAEMRLRELHRWDVTPKEAMEIQRRLAGQVACEGHPGDVRLVGATDVSYVRSPAGYNAQAAVALLSWPEARLTEHLVEQGMATFPYVPGLLSFREIPLLAGVLERATVVPDLLLVDGQGRAHPRRFGIACHVGLLTDLPTIGCAKSRLCGEHQEPGVNKGSWVPLTDRGEVIGAAVRTRDGVKPVYVSIGHRIGLEVAIEWVLRLSPRWRVPEPIRWADRLSRQDQAAIGDESWEPG